jgi:hypothetical protein
VRDSVFPIIKKHVGNAYEADMFCKTVSAFLQQFAYQKLKESKIRDIVPSMDKEGEAAYSELFKVLGEETLDDVQVIVSNIGNAIEFKVRQELKERSLDSLNLVFVNPDEEDKGDTAKPNT